MVSHLHYDASRATRATHRVSRLRVGARLQQRRRDVRVAARRGGVQRRARVFVALRRPRARGQQRLRQRGVALLRRPAARARARSGFVERGALKAADAGRGARAGAHQCSGVSPTALAARGSAPARSSSAATGAAFFSAAECSGVTPTRLAARASAPAASSCDATALCPRSAVQCSAVQPPCGALRVSRGAKKANHAPLRKRRACARRGRKLPPPRALRAQNALPRRARTASVARASAPHSISARATSACPPAAA